MDGIKGLKNYIEKIREKSDKARANFNERFESHPLWALEGVAWLARAEADREQAESANRLIEIYEKHMAADIGDEDRLAYEDELGCSLDSSKSEKALLDYLERYLRKNLVNRARSADNRSTSVSSNLVDDCRIAAIATFLDDRIWHWN